MKSASNTDQRYDFDYVLPCGTRLGDATRDQLAAAIKILQRRGEALLSGKIANPQSVRRVKRKPSNDR